MIIRKVDLNDFFFCVFLALSGLGNYYNELYQIANIIVLSDIGLALFLCSLLITSCINLQRKHGYLIICFISMLIIGLLGNHMIGDILRDIKVFLYFFAAYLYCYSRKDDYLYVSRLSKTMLTMVVFTIIVCTTDFLEHGLSGLSSKQILRTFGLGLSQYGLAVSFVILMSIGSRLREKIGKITYYALLVMCLTLSITSYTRSVWLLLILSIALYYLLNIISGVYKDRFSANQIIRIIIYGTAICMAFLMIYRYLEQNYPDIVSLFIGRMQSISSLGSGEIVNGNADTLTGRLDGLKDYIPKYTNPLIIVGWGFGDRGKNSVSTITENSFLYYSWKYGIIWSVVLLYRLYDKFKTIFRRKNKINNAVLSSLIAYIIMGGMSGHLNKYYMLPYIAIFLLIDFDRFFVADNVEEYHEEIALIQDKGD